MAEAGLTFFTICPRAAVAHASCLAESIARHHPGAAFTAWLIGEGPFEFNGPICARKCRECIDEIDEVLFYNRYGPKRVAELLLPAIFQKLFSEGASRVVFLAAESRLYAPLADIVECFDLGTAGIFTPQLLRPVPDDGLAPDDLYCLNRGVCNLGLIALAAHPSTVDFLGWWKRWLNRLSLRDWSAVCQDSDVDLVSLALTLWKEFEVLRLPNLNAGHWNLHERNLARDPDGAWLVEGVPLSHFHFAGFDFLNPWIISKDNSRLTVAKGSALANLLEDYARSVVSHGAENASALGDTPIKFVDGLSFDRVATDLLFEAFQNGAQFCSVCGVGQGSFREHLLHIPAGKTHPLYVTKLFQIRPDLVRPYGQSSLAEIKTWIRVSGVPELGLEPLLVESDGIQAEVRAITYIGYLRSMIGLGEGARGHIEALRTVGIEPNLYDVSYMTGSGINENSIQGSITNTLHPTPITVIEVNADKVAEVFADLELSTAAPDTYKIGVWAWETADFPDRWLPKFSYLDEIWCGSEFIAEAIARKSPVPVVCIPYCLEVPEVKPHKASFGLSEEEFVFLFTFDFFSCMERKNPYSTIAAFRMAFSPEEPVRLLVKTINAKHRPEELEKMRRSAEGLRVTIVDEALSVERRYQLLASCDAYVSLHRAEGFGYGMAEAMAYGKPVVATGWSGNLEFMDPWNSYLVDYVLCPLEEDMMVYEKGTMWAVPSIEDASRQMRLVWNDEGRRIQVGTRARRDILARVGVRVVGERMRARLEVIARNRGVDSLLMAQRTQPLAQDKKKQVAESLKLPSLSDRAKRLIAREGLGGALRRVARVLKS